MSRPSYPRPLDLAPTRSVAAAAVGTPKNQLTDAPVSGPAEPGGAAGRWPQEDACAPAPDAREGGGARATGWARLSRRPPLDPDVEAPPWAEGPPGGLAQFPRRGASRRLHLRLPILPFCAGAMVRTTEQDGALWHLFDARDVPRFFAQEKYTCFYWHAASGPEEHLLADSLDALEVRLSAFAFVRTHRAELVNLRFVRRVALAERGGPVVVELADGQRAPISRRRLGQVRATLRRLRAGHRLPDQLAVRALPL